MPKPTMRLADSGGSSERSQESSAAQSLRAVTNSPRDNSYEIVHLSYPIVNSPFITITVNSTPKVSLTWNPNDNAPDYFTSLSQTRYVSQGNVGKLNLTYVPKPGENPDLFEVALWNARGRCTYQYGMAGYRSAVYSGLIYDYTVNLANGVQEYSLDLIGYEGFSLKSWIQNAKWNIPAQEERNSDWLGYAMSPSYYVFSVVTGIIKDYLDDAYEFIDDVSERSLTDKDKRRLSELRTTIVEKAAIISDREKYREAEYAFWKEVGEPYRLLSSALHLEGLTPLRAIRALANHLIKPITDNTYDRSVSYYISVAGPTETSKGQIRLFSSEHSSPPEGADLDVTYVFEWNSKNSIVKSWSIDYRGVATIFNSTESGVEGTTTEESELGQVAIATYSKADIAAILNDELDRISGATASDTVEVSDTIKRRFHRIQQYPYKATLEVLGVPDTNFYLGKHIYVIPYINGEIHHSAGEYLVLGITDSISGSGFMTKLDLVKIISDDWKRKLGIPREASYTLSRGTRVYSADGKPVASVGVTRNNKVIRDIRMETQ